MTRIDQQTLGDLVAFARVELDSGDIEPWAAVLGACLPAWGYESTAWMVKLYNAYDDLGSAVRAHACWPSPQAWRAPPPRFAPHVLAGQFPCGRERRNLRGGDPNKLVRHLDSYVAFLHGQDQVNWLQEAFPRSWPEGAAFDALMKQMRRVWGTGRLAAFEWAEFAGKVLGLPVKAGDGCLWESSGPRESLERIYNGGAKAKSQDQLDIWALRCKEYLAECGAALDWWDLETVICDFNVMRKGKYYPGQHIAMIRDEIEALAVPWRDVLGTALMARIPEPWCDVPPGVNKQLAASYALDGKIRTPFGRVI